MRDTTVVPYPVNSAQNGQEFCATGVPPVKNIALAGRPMPPFFRAFAASREKEILFGSGLPRLGDTSNEGLISRRKIVFTLKVN